MELSKEEKRGGGGSHSGRGFLEGQGKNGRRAVAARVLCPPN